MKLKNHSNPNPPPPVKETHIHHAPSIAGPFLAKAIVTLASLFAGWHITLYLLDKAGFRHPAEALASFLVWAGLFALVGFVASHWSRDILDRWLSHRLELEQERTQQLRYKQLLAGSVAEDSRQLGQHKRLAALVYLVMMDAYDHLAERGPFEGNERPWSSRQAGQHILFGLGEHEPAGREFGAQVRGLLQQHQVITGNQINLQQYPDINSIHRLLYTPPLLRGDSDEPELPNWSIID